MALKHAVVEAVWIRDLLAEMGLQSLIAEPTTSPVIDTTVAIQCAGDESN